MPVDWFVYPQRCGHHTLKTTDLIPPVSLGVAYCVAFWLDSLTHCKRHFTVAAVFVVGCYLIPKL